MCISVIFPWTKSINYVPKLCFPHIKNLVPKNFSRYLIGFFFQAHLSRNFIEHLQNFKFWNVLSQWLIPVITFYKIGGVNRTVPWLYVPQTGRNTLCNTRMFWIVLMSHPVVIVLEQFWYWLTKLWNQNPDFELIRIAF